MSLPRRPTSELYRLASIWRPGGAQRTEWEEVHAELSGCDRTPLKRRWEAMAAPGPESYASAIVAFDASTEDVRVRVETPAYEDRHPDGVPWLGCASGRGAPTSSGDAKRRLPRHRDGARHSGSRGREEHGLVHLHRDYENSAKLNAYLDGGGRTYYVTYRGVTYEVTVQPGG